MDELFDLANAIGCFVRANSSISLVTGKKVYSVSLLMYGSTPDIMDRGLLKSAWGSGESLDAAADDYLRQIEGRRIVFNPMGSLRFEYDVPFRKEAAQNAVRQCLDH